MAIKKWGNWSPRDARETAVTVQGTSGADYYVGSDYDDDELYGNGGNDTLNGAAGNDDLYGGEGDDSLVGSTGADTLDGGEGSDTLNGGEGFDYASYASSTAGVTVEIGAQTDGHDTYISIEGLIGSAFNDSLTGGEGDNRLIGGGGNDVLKGGHGADTLHGGAGADYMEGGARDGNAEYADEDIDILSYVDSATGVTVDLETRAGAGEGESKGDVFIGMDRLHGSVHDDVLYGRNTDGDAGESQDDNIFAAAGHDLILGRAGNDTLDGWDGNDTLEGGTGGDLLQGWAGFDFASYASSTEGVSASLGITIPPPEGEVMGDEYHSIEGLIGSQHDDTLYGSDDLKGELRGGAGNDDLTGGSLSDTLEGGAGADILIGGGSLDYASYAHAGTGVVADLTNIYTELAPTGLAAGTGDAAGDRYHSIEGLIGSGRADALYGDAEDNHLRGLGGNDVLVGRGGADTLDGGTGNDTFYVDHAGDRVIESSRGGTDTVRTRVSFTLGSQTENLTAEGSAAVTLKGSSLANTITGNSGSNKIHGGLGNDLLRGGSGKDVFVFDTKPNKSSNVDKVYDFSSSSDGFHLENKVFTKLGSGSSSGVRFKSDMFVEASKAQDREDRIVYDRSKGYLYYDADGTGSSAQVKIATIVNKAKLYYHDFFVI